MPWPEFLGTIFAGGPEADASAFTPLRLVGRLHPIVVHFPVALAIVAAGLETTRSLRRLPGPSPATAGLLLTAGGFALFAAVTGWLNAAWEYAEAGGETLFWHRWLGLFAALFLVPVGLLARRASQASPLASSGVAQRLGTWAAAILVAITGHFGGELVHGEGYVSKGLRSRRGTETVSRAATPVSLPDDPVEAFYRSTIEPMVLAHCAECHGERKQKGGLRLDPIDAAFDGPADLWPIVPGSPEASEVYIRVTLPRDDADAMPPDGHGLTPDEISSLRRWIIEGARYPAAEVAGVPPSSATDITEPSVDEAPDWRALEVRISERGGRLLPVARDSDLFELNVSLAQPPWTDSDLKLIGDIAPRLVALNLAGSRVTDEGLLRLPATPRLERLRLDRTAIGDRAVEALARLPSLRSLNVVGTRIGDAGLVGLGAIPSLRAIYVWQSEVSVAGVAALRERRADLDVIDGSASAEGEPP